MAELLASGFGIGVFAVGVQILALIAVYGTACAKEVRFYAVAFALASCVMAGMAMLDPLAFPQWHVDGLAVMAMCG
ncbi:MULTISPECIES: hypothetical protein [Pseudomonas]|jgi:hypothetical protein|uniref:Uncharacterized protein n=3 Tax=Pseudomonas TaxID=286 RepID=A0A099N4P2_PSEDL|nr:MULTISPECIES: hypothetical protein [Pseudomonas]AHC83745.1 hypothetical protein X969_17930 [Pseudomonas monteilii SB3078]AHC89117.1 hypothetical protein X970_17565 [Pseudomonas monteilii SB3101]AHZ78671.1 hypothetical protein DW66_4167 [Pseudomonas putida]AJG12278.1 hypothetical protein RK21_00770 [Pseudomonas plecoglossicida]ESW36483.1 hypothetical protein O164_29505 [Pseudomonas taiwanensis SJ9]